MTESESRSQSWCRNYIGVSVALVEGFRHCLREICAVGCSACSTPSISPKEHQVLNAENDFDTGERIKLTLRETLPAANGHTFKRVECRILTLFAMFDTL